MTRRPLAALLWLASCATPPVAPAPAPAPPSAGPAAAASSAAPATAAPRPPVVVALVVDQLGAWVARERLELLPATGGFARLRREGTWVVEARHPHAVTDTAPGHSVLLTGAEPARSGIFGNEVPSGNERLSILRDEASRLIGPAGKTDVAGSSLARLRVPTVADRLRARHQDALIAAVSLKDRGALFGCGRTPDACLWFEPGLDAFVTSTAFGAELPGWARDEASAEATARARSTPWTPLDQAWVTAHTTSPDDQRGEGDWWGLGRVFPHDVAHARKPSTAFRASPAGDERVLALATAAARLDRAGTVPTMLTVSLSSNDYVGHVFGPDSWEAWDELRRLDQALGAFLSALDARFGPDGHAEVLSADHGVTPLPETAADRAMHPWCARTQPDRWQRVCQGGGRLVSAVVARRLDQAASRALPGGPWVAGVADPYVYVTPAAAKLPAEGRARLLDAITREALRDPCIERVVDAQRPPAACPPLSDESTEALVCRSIPPTIEGQLYLVPRPGCFFDSDYVTGHGTSHGTPYLYDRAVPVLARAPGRIAPGKVIDDPMPSFVYTATVASLLGLDLDEAWRGVPSLLSR